MVMAAARLDSVFSAPGAAARKARRRKRRRRRDGRFPGIPFIIDALSATTKHFQALAAESVGRLRSCNDTFNASKMLR
jgi:hypothetical protein